MWLCSICSQLFGKSNDRLCVTRCGHVYHSACIMKWLETASSCPECREFCDSEDLTQIYLNSNVANPERIDEVKRLNAIQSEGLETLEEMEQKVDENYNSEHKFFDDFRQSVKKLKDLIISIEDISCSLTDLYIRGKDAMDRQTNVESEDEDSEAVNKALLAYAAKLQRDFECYASENMKLSSEAYDNNLNNVLLRSEKTSLEIDKQIAMDKEQLLKNCISLLRNEITEKQIGLREEIKKNQKLAEEYRKLEDRNSELVVELGLKEAEASPYVLTINRLNGLIYEKCELVALQERRIANMDYRVESLEEKLQIQKIEAISKSEEKQTIIREQKRQLSKYAIQCGELNHKNKNLEEKLHFYEAVLRGVVEQKGELDSSSLTLRRLCRVESKDSKTEQSTDRKK